MEIPIEKYNVYIRPGWTDMRKCAPSLAVLVQSQMGLDPFGKSVFVFCGRSRRILKAVVWDGTGWFEAVKRLSASMTFKWPQTEEAARLASWPEIAGLLRGNDVWRLFRPSHPAYAN